MKSMTVSRSARKVRSWWASCSTSDHRTGDKPGGNSPFPGNELQCKDLQQMLEHRGWSDILTHCLWQGQSLKHHLLSSLGLQCLFRSSWMLQLLQLQESENELQYFFLWELPWHIFVMYKIGVWFLVIKWWVRWLFVLQDVQGCWTTCMQFAFCLVFWTLGTRD